MDSQTTTIAAVAVAAVAVVATIAYFYLAEDEKKKKKSLTSKSNVNVVSAATAMGGASAIKADAKAFCDKQTFLKVFKDIMRELEVSDFLGRMGSSLIYYPSCPIAAGVAADHAGCPDAAADVGESNAGGADVEDYDASGADGNPADHQQSARAARRV